jgi:hypothetical protein
MYKKVSPLIVMTHPRGEGEGEETSFSQQQLDAAVASAVAKATDEATGALGTKNKELLGDLRKAKDAAKRFDGIDPDQVRIMMSAFENDQDLKDISEGKHEEVINRRIEKERAKFTSDVNSLTEKTTVYENENASLKTRVSKLLIDNNVVSEFVKEKGLESGIEDVILRANQIFKVEGEDLLARDQSGEIIAGGNGPLTISEWVTGLKDKAPHLFPGSNGSQTPGGGPDGGQSGIAAKIEAAAKSGDMKEYRRLRDLQRQGKSE